MISPRRGTPGWRKRAYPLSLREKARVRALPLPVDPATITPTLSQREGEDN
jgi:hypothetical protein